MSKVANMLNMLQILKNKDIHSIQAIEDKNKVLKEKIK